MIRCTLTIGVYDKDTKRQKISSDIARRLVSDLIVDTLGYGTIHDGAGIYTHTGGAVVVEPSLIVFYDGSQDDENKINDLAWRIKKVLNQESIMLEKTAVNVAFI